ncbi:Maltose/maltodextrin import ATP-binding protein MalK [Saezia sanguinis]|uniref:Maltose/maltodextrin import ATP-binding protein MalK n=1 Tax=Saezia sanguinis TaxID=1965230 RepID=A0A433SDH5_9BURK|nr:ABC transporter ATP-binding protein [Saezia sanguinis]RUS66746.1 Maltose/maltodextrin import ATP-binding protein MalK [Saezia sanguinis]
MAKVSLQGIKKQFGDTVTISDLYLDVREGELLTLLGPSGCGKTTVLRLIAGFTEPTQGQIFIGGVDVTKVPVQKRGTGMVFQRYALFPHMTVEENVAFGLQMHGVPVSEREKRVHSVLDMMRMVSLKSRYPRQLSGGQQQRVAIARALAIEPKVFLLDEPLSNLDAKLRLEVREEIRELQQRLGLTTIFVTHDQAEALAIADRVAIMHEGKVQQLGAPEDLYGQPANLFVADFLGKMNFFAGRMDGTHQFLCQGGARIAVTQPVKDAISLGVRPERMVLQREASGHENCLPGKVESVVYQGSQLDVFVRLNQGEDICVQIVNTEQVQQDEPMVPGMPVYACFQAGDGVLFAQ